MSSSPRVPASAPPPPQWAAPQPPPQETEGANADLFDYAKLRDYLFYALHSIRRRKLRIAVVAAGLTAASFAIFLVLPKSYHCEIKIQAQRNVVISTLAGLTRSWEYESPARAANDLVMRYDNLISIVSKSNLVQTFDASRSPLLRLKDNLFRKFRGDLPAEVKQEMAVGALEQALVVFSSEDTVTIAIDWPDAQAAYRIIRAAHENFLEARQYKEVSAVSEAIGLLQGRAVEAREKVYQALERLQKVRPVKAKKGPVKAEPSFVRARTNVDPDLQRLRAQIQSKRQVILEMEEFRRRRIAEASSKLAELKQVFSEFHPAVIDLEQSIQQQEREENPQLALLRHDFQQLEEEYEKRGGPANDHAENALGSALPLEAMQLGRTSDEIESPEVEQAKGDLKHEVGRYSSLLDKIEQAKTELESQRAAFNYRYGVLRPAQLPTTPLKPRRLFIVGAGAAMGLILGLLAALLADLRSRRVLEPWQVERQLGVAVLGQVDLP